MWCRLAVDAVETTTGEADGDRTGRRQRHRQPVTAGHQAYKPRRVYRRRHV